MKKIPELKDEGIFGTRRKEMSALKEWKLHFVI